jgi:hypothetical protein
MEGSYQPLWYLRLILSQFYRLVAAEVEEVRPGPNSSAFPWVLVVCVAMVGLLAVLFFLWLCAIREDILTTKISELMEEKCKLLEKVSLAQKELEGLESSLREASSEKVSTEVESLKATYEELKRSKSQLMDEILFLEKELQKEKSKYSQQQQLKAEQSKTEQSLKEEIKSLASQLAEARENHLMLQTSETQLKDLIREALKENSQLKARQIQLQQEIKAKKTQVRELKKQKIALESYIAHAEDVLYDRDDHIWSLISRIAKMREWAEVLGEDLTADGDLKIEMIGLENAAHLKIQPKSALEKLVYGAMLKACLQTMEKERKQTRTQLFEVNKTRHDLTYRIKSLHAELASLQSQNTQAEQENQKLQQKVEIMMELYLQNGRELSRKLTEEENYQLEIEKEVSKKMENLSQVAEELDSYIEQARNLDDKLETCILHHQKEIMQYEVFERLTSSLIETSERSIQNFKEHTSQRRRQLSEREDKHTDAPRVPQTACGREARPHDPSTSGQASSTSSRRHPWSFSRLLCK